MKNIKVIIVVFILIAIGAAIHLSMKKSERVATLKQAASAFALLDTTAIDKIIIFDGKDEVTLLKKSDKWLFNGVDPANKPAISELLKAMLLLKPIKPVAESEMDKDAIELRSTGVKVQFYAGEIEDRAFYVNKSNATLMMMVSTGAPHFVSCEGYGNAVNQLFASPIQDWKTNKIFTSKQESIQSVELVSSQLHSFNLQYDAGTFKLTNSTKQPSKEQINAFFNSLLNLEIEKYVADAKNMKPLAVLEIQDVDIKRNNEIEVLSIDKNNVLIKNVKKNRSGYISKKEFENIFVNILK